MKGQKQAVIEEVLNQLPTFNKYVDNAILKLSNSQLESIKFNIFNGIITGAIEYGKDKNNHTEARTYARSMVMNHLKKAKELNGNISYETRPAAGTRTKTTTVAVKKAPAPKGVDVSLLPDDLAQFVKKLV